MTDEHFENRSKIKISAPEPNIAMLVHQMQSQRSHEMIKNEVINKFLVFSLLYVLRFHAN